MKEHSQFGYDYVEYMDYISVNAKKAILDHHEQYDGQGYPSGLSCEQISFFGRIVSLADVYDALTSRRTYRPALSHRTAAEIIRNSGCKFDPDILEVFSQEFIELYT